MRDSDRDRDGHGDDRGTIVPKGRTAMPKFGGSPAGFQSKVVMKLASSLRIAIEAR
ncbi:hypothetical protein SALBM217S_07474 [Streptomyces griseoloalbus]